MTTAAAEAPDSIPPPRLLLRGITKRYPTVLANDSVDLTVGVGEIHALIGENGAGKSTLMQILYGVIRPDAGSIVWEGRSTDIPSPAAARRLGIGMVFQHFALFDTLTVAQNVALALDYRSSPVELAPRITAVAARYGLPVDPTRLVHSMSVGERQRVEIVRCLLQSPKLLIMDEPTSVLTPQAVQQLFDTLLRLARDGTSIIYISHKLDEIRALCDSATVLRGGRVSGTACPRLETNSSLARLMVGSDVSPPSLAPTQSGDVQLLMRNYSSVPRDSFGTSLNNIDLAVRAGEIVGIAGISGNGQKELMAALSGEYLEENFGAQGGSAHQGSIALCGTPADRLDAGARREMGFGFIPEERLGRGTVPTMSLADNTLLTGWRGGLVRFGLIKNSAVRASARRTILDFKVSVGSDLSRAEGLSGGNLQKFIVGREIRLAPKVLCVAQPTWGVDVGAARMIHQALIDLRNRGAAILVVSEDLEELLSLCDKIAVLSAGRLSPPRARSQVSIEAIGLLMAHVGATHA